MEINLKKQQLELLKKYSSLRLSPNTLPENKRQVAIVGDKQYFEKLLDEISNVLIEKGMDDNDEPNELGFQIEEVIDILSKVVYDCK